MSANLVKAGHRVRGFDLSEAACAEAAAAGVQIVASIAEAVDGADIVFTMLPQGQHVRAVLEGPGGVLANLAPGTLVVDSSTIAIDDAKEFHQLVTAAGFRFLDAPVSGGVPGATAGTLTFMIGGADDDLAEAQPIIQAMAGRIFHIGPAASGQAAKIVNNMMLAINLAATSEGAVLADRLGLDPTVFYEMAKVSSGDSWTLRTWYPMPGVVETAGVNRDFEGGFATNLMIKDLGLALDAGRATGTPLDIAAHVAQQLDELRAAGFGGKDCSSFVKLVDGTMGAG